MHHSLLGAQSASQRSLWMSLLSREFHFNFQPASVFFNSAFPALLYGNCCAVPLLAPASTTAFINSAVVGMVLLSANAAWNFSAVVVPDPVEDRACRGFRTLGAGLLLGIPTASAASWITFTMASLS